jgi:hypothetical protein
MQYSTRTQPATHQRLLQARLACRQGLGVVCAEVGCEQNGVIQEVVVVGHQGGLAGRLAEPDVVQT